jgi:hypothetical protein
MTDDSVTDLTRGVYRRLYSGFTTGQRINKISLNAEAWFWRILATVDDFGNGRADPHLCKDATAGLRRQVTAKQISGWLREMQAAGLVQFYSVKGEPYLHVVNFEETQPAGKNGRRLKRHPIPGESEGIQEIPDVVSASDSDNDPDTKDDAEKKKAQAPDSPPFTSDEFLKALDDFEQHRKEIKHKLTPKARQGLYADFMKWGESKSIIAIRQSIRNQWRGVFEPKEESSNGTYTQNNGLRRTDATERNAERLHGNIELIQELRRGTG